MPMPRALFAAAALLLATAPAAAQPSASHRAAAEDVIEASGSRENFLRAMELGMREGGLAEMAPAVQAGMREVLNDLFSWEVMREPFIAVFSDLYTEAELRQIAAAYRTPGGRLLVRRAPEAAVRTQAIVQKRLTEVMPEMMRRITALLEADTGS
jgi:uncharacterized protein